MATDAPSSEEGPTEARVHNAPGGAIITVAENAPSTTKKADLEEEEEEEEGEEAPRPEEKHEEEADEEDEAPAAAAEPKSPPSTKADQEEGEADQEEGAQQNGTTRSSRKIVISDIPKLCNWSSIRKMFAPLHSKIRDGRVEANAGYAWVEMESTEAAETAATKHAGHDFEDDAWRVPYKDIPRDDGEEPVAPRRRADVAPPRRVYDWGAGQGDRDAKRRRRYRDDDDDDSDEAAATGDVATEARPGGGSSRAVRL
mmetsp:Transcript_14781/g.59177  ORF Transcript_14781/g.59177 Transcript_14781/m.59177 type:complete len:256 (+) Transcript_14781:39-806(+)